VLATIHAQDAAGAIDALHYLGVPHHVIGSSLRLIIAQNLIRRLCPECAQPVALEDQDRELFAQSAMEAPDHLMQAGGCPNCHSYGYKGRTGVFEVAQVDDEVATFIRSGSHHREITDCFRKKGTRSMTEDGLEKAALGVTSLEEIRRVCAFSRGIELMRRLTDPLSLDIPEPARSE